jgi:molybdate transport system substrate-binding protein
MGADREDLGGESGSVSRLDLISAGAAKGVVEALTGRFLEATGATIAGTFGAVGAMKEKLLAGAPCDAIVLTQALLEGLASDGRVRGETIRPLGRVYTGIAVRTGDAAVPLESEDALRNSLRMATSLYFPDPKQATAGIHFMKVLEQLGLRDELGARLKPHPNGATAMAALAAAIDPRPIGCTQVTEIKYTPGVTLVGVLPKAFELGTLYSAAVCVRAADSTLAERFVELVTGAESKALRSTAGFED